MAITASRPARTSQNAVRVYLPVILTVRSMTVRIIWVVSTGCEPGWARNT